MGRSPHRTNRLPAVRHLNEHDAEAIHGNLTLGQDISVEHKIHQADERNAGFIRVERLDAVHDHNLPERIADLAKPPCFLFDLVRPCETICRLNVDLLTPKIDDEVDFQTLLFPSRS